MTALINEAATADILTPRYAGVSLRAWKAIGLAVLLAGAVALPFLVSNYRVFQFNLVLIYAIVLLGLNILTGYNGQISLGHGAFYAIGAYVAAILMDHFGWPYWATLPVAGLACFVFGFLFGLPALRLRGHYLALATFALAVAMPQILKYKHIEQWTGGVQGIVIIKPDAPFGLKITPDQWLYLFTLAILVLMFAIGWNLLRGRVGRALVAIRDHPVAAEAMGVHSALYKTLAVRRQRIVYRCGRRARRRRGSVCRAGQLYGGVVHQFPGRHRDRRCRLDLGRLLWRAVHPVRAQLRRPDLQGRALGDLRRVPAGVCLSDADRGRRICAARMDADARRKARAGYLIRIE